MTEERRRHERPNVEILVVEDSPTQAEQLRFMLEGHEFIPFVAANGREALAFLAEHRPELIVTDIVMPEMDGYELSRRVKADERLKDIPIVMLTALAEPNAVLKGLECGADNFITKPYKQEYLLSRIRYILANRELRKVQQMEIGIQVAFGGERYFITSERQQILDLLLSTYETAVQKNLELNKAQDELRELNDTLEQRVRQRTAELAQAEESLRKANRALRAISLCNEVLVRATDEDTLLKEVCQTIVDAAGYGLAWVGYGERDEAEAVHPVAKAGRDAAYLDLLDLRCQVEGRPCVPAARAIRSGTPVVVPDIAAEPPNPWREEMVKHDYRSAVAFPLRVDDHVIGALSIDSAEPNATSGDELNLLSELVADLGYGIGALRARARQAHLEREREEAALRLRSALLGTVQTMSRTIEQRDPYTAGHQERVAQLAEAIAREMGLPEVQAEGVRIGGLIHDIGKIHIPAEILTRPQLLSQLEYDIVKTHPQAGADIVKGVEFPWPVAEMIMQHHERLDGSGYPNGLKSGEIMLEAKILAVADVVEAMASHRPYRPGIGLEAALGEIERHRGRLYDQAAADACLRLFREKGFQLGARTGLS